VANPTVELIVKRESTNRLNTQKVGEAMQKIVGTVKNRTSCPNIKASYTNVMGPKVLRTSEGEKYLYQFTVVLEKLPPIRSENAAMKHLENARKYVTRTASNCRWIVEGDTQEVADKESAQDEREPFEVERYIEEGDLEKYFSTVYDRESHVKLIHETVVNYIDTKGMERTNILLHGKPAAAKTQIFGLFKRYYERDSDTERVAEINASTLTKAGLENWLLDRAKSGTLPEILCFDELEKIIKVSPQSLYCLLSIMDNQAKITKLNAKIGKQEETCRCLIWATCNDTSAIDSFCDGALWSRFGYALECKRPDESRMTQILHDKINSWQKLGIPAQHSWVPAAMEFAKDYLRTDDPRKILTLLNGGNRLLTGDYQRDMIVAGGVPGFTEYNPVAPQLEFSLRSY
jgi:hypothetical protein